MSFYMLHRSALNFNLQSPNVSHILILSIGLITFIPLKAIAQNGPQAVQDFADATCHYKKVLGNPPSEVAIAMMLNGMLAANPPALESWAAISGGKTYWGYITAGKKANNFLEYVKLVSSDTLQKQSVAAVKRPCGT